jgi:hypothetical protein
MTWLMTWNSGRSMNASIQYLGESLAFVRLGPNGIQFSYNPFATKELGRLEHADLIWQDGGSTPFL